MQDSQRPIGVFDSGLGGLAVLAQLRARLPGEDFVYLADQRHAPYGDLSVETVRQLTVEAVDHLVETHAAKMVVIACNTASDAALDHVRKLRATPFVGMEPAVKPAVAASVSGRIGVLATTRTIEGERLARVITAHAAGRTVISCACPGLVELVEDGLSHSQHAEALVASYVDPLVEQGVDTLVLGCTHYSFLHDTIATVAGPTVSIIDPAEAVAEQTARVLEGLPFEGRPVLGGSVRFETSGDGVRMRRQLREILDEDAPTHQLRAGVDS